MKKRIKDLTAKEFEDYFLDTPLNEELRERYLELMESESPSALYDLALAIIDIFDREVEIKEEEQCE